MTVEPPHGGCAISALPRDAVALMPHAELESEPPLGAETPLPCPVLKDVCQIVCVGLAQSARLSSGALPQVLPDMGGKLGSRMPRGGSTESTGSSPASTAIRTSRSWSDATSVSKSSAGGEDAGKEILETSPTSGPAPCSGVATTTAFAMEHVCDAVCAARLPHSHCSAGSINGTPATQLDELEPMCHVDGPKVQGQPSFHDLWAGGGRAAIRLSAVNAACADWLGSGLFGDGFLIEASDPEFHTDPEFARQLVEPCVETTESRMRPASVPLPKLLVPNSYLPPGPVFPCFPQKEKCCHSSIAGAPDVDSLSLCTVCYTPSGDSATEGEADAAAGGASPPQKVGVGEVSATPLHDQALSSRRRSRLWVHIYLHMRCQGFDLVPILIGRKGCNMRRIAESTGAKIRVRGRGSGHIEAETQREAPSPLHVAVTTNAWEHASFKKALELTVEHLRALEERFRSRCASDGTNRQATAAGFSFGLASEGAWEILSDPIFQGVTRPHRK